MQSGKFFIIHQRANLDRSGKEAFSAQKDVMSTIEAFIWGFGGSIAAEIVILERCYHRIAPSGLPERYKRIGFYVVRLLLAILAGCVAIAYNVQNPVLALSIGIAAPLVIQNLKGGYKG